MAKLIVVLLLSLAAGGMAAPADDDPRLAESRDIVRDFAGRLQAALQSAMASGGPVNAIGVCKDLAPAIASELSRERGAAVSRTSLRLRNPANLARDWQVGVLEDFDAHKGTDPGAAPDFFEARPDGQFRYMKAIPTGGLCLTCHGTTIPDDVRELLNEHYPHDRALGYEAGDMRGAFSIIWPRPCRGCAIAD
ncbi:MAG TPA: DUF3365 domain-containing protein [Woeseiaceae bacterium]|nr:DUF3365 domain-containing protein [Woeseiaceae bacterium]